MQCKNTNDNDLVASFPCSVPCNTDPLAPNTHEVAGSQ